jgi:hypothetical protein
MFVASSLLEITPLFQVADQFSIHQQNQNKEKKSIKRLYDGILG